MRLLTANPLSRLLSRFIRESRGNMALIAAVAAVPLIIAMGAAIDYTLASYRQDQINGFADSATLAAVTPSMMTNDSAAQSKAVALSLFTAQLATIPNVAYSTANISVNASDATGTATVIRTVTLTYTVNSNNIFSSILGINALPISGKSTATSSTAPNINFWMLLDDSPSMAIAATTAGINTMVANTSSQGGCAFACHESDPAADGLGNPGGEDNYALARHLGVVLRIDMVNTAMQSLLSSAATTATQYNTNYQFALYTMDSALNPVSTYNTPSTLTPSQISSLSVTAVEYYKNNWRTSTEEDNDTDSYLDQSMGAINAIMPTPGNGTNNKGDTPQEVLYIVTDGLDDYYAGSNRTYSPIGQNYSWCTTVKNRGIRIAMLYLTYNPLPTNSWYNSYIAPFQPSIATQAQNCASPGLYFQVNTDGDITAAMNTLFQRAVATAHLSQ